MSTMFFTIRKCVSNVIAVPNPTSYTKLDSYKVKTKVGIGPKLVRNADVAFLLSLNPNSFVTRCCLTKLGLAHSSHSCDEHR